MTEISEYEKQLNPGLSFERHIERLTSNLAERVDAPALRNDLYQWNAWVLDLPQDLLDLNLLRNVEWKYVHRADVRADDLPDYTYLLKACGVYAAAAQRARNRADSSAAWDLLIAAIRCLNKFVGIENELFILEQKTARSARAVSNGDVPGQRVRYRIVSLLHRDRDHQKSPTLFKTVKAAIDPIDDDIARFIEDNKLNISYVNMVKNVKRWIRDHPAFRAEIAPFFTDGVIEN